MFSSPVTKEVATSVDTSAAPAIWRFNCRCFDKTSNSKVPLLWRREMYQFRVPLDRREMAVSSSRRMPITWCVAWEYVSRETESGSPLISNLSRAISSSSPTPVLQFIQMLCVRWPRSIPFRRSLPFGLYYLPDHRHRRRAHRRPGIHLLLQPV